MKCFALEHVQLETKSEQIISDFQFNHGDGSEREPRVFLVPLGFWPE